MKEYVELYRTASRRILLYCDFACNSGFAEVATQVLRGLIPVLQKKNWVCDVAAINYHAENFLYSDRIRVINPISFAKNRDDIYRRDGVAMMLKEGEYDLLWCINDIDVLHQFIELCNYVRSMRIKHQRRTFKIMVYTPIDSKPKKDNALRVMNYADDMVTYTKYGQKLLYDVKKGKTITVIRHGCSYLESEAVIQNDPLGKFIAPERKELRKKYFGCDDEDINEWFVYGNINRNSVRKNIGDTILAFSKIKASTNSKVKLYLQCDPKDPMGVDVEQCCMALDLVYGTDVIVPKNYDHLKGGYSEGEMKDIYRCLDAYVTTTMAEGWGLTVMEAMGMGIPTIYPNHTSLTEITKNRGFRVNEVIETIPAFDANNVRFKAELSSVEKMMTSVLYHSRLDMNGYSQTMIPVIQRQYEVAKSYEWKNIVEDWEKKLSWILK